MLLFLLACTFGPGHGFGELEPVLFSAVLEPGPARDLGNGEILTRQGYAVKLDHFVVGLGSLELLELQGASGDATFDPADPPPGYGLCHGGHCHADDGSLVSYADIQAELAGGNAAFVPLVSLEAPSTVDLVAGSSATLSPDDPVLPAASLSLLQLHSSSLSLSGQVRREPADEFSSSFQVDLPLTDGFSAGIELELARGEDPVLNLAVALSPDGTLFDELDFAALSTEGAWTVDSVDAPGADALLAAVGSVEPTLSLERSSWSQK